MMQSFAFTVINDRHLYRPDTRQLYLTCIEIKFPMKSFKLNQFTFCRTSTNATKIVSADPVLNDVSSFWQGEPVRTRGSSFRNEFGVPQE